MEQRTVKRQINKPVIEETADQVSKKIYLSQEKGINRGRHNNKEQKKIAN